MKAYSVNYDGTGMVYWEKNDDSAQYIIYLYLNAKCWRNGNMLDTPEFLKSKRTSIVENDVVNQVINIITVPREKTYHTFDDLVHVGHTKRYDGYLIYTGLFYSCKIIAEDKNGNKIDESNEVQL